ncbi:type I glyceraldehyde-3-phosphate dehydrogenase [bacterium]|nr:type I glyceraldehyde-3-phosphate dehydrogenase [bacterium]
MKIKIAINGFGRIGRTVTRIITEKYYDLLDIVAINDLTDTETLAHLLKYDSSYGIFKKVVKAKENKLLIDGTSEGKTIDVFSEKDPEKLPWKEMAIDVVLECTGVFRDIEGSRKHIKAGAKKVIISAPAKSEEIPTYLLGVNQEKYNPEKDDIVSMGSCTTNCLAPVAKVINNGFGIIKGFMTTVHSYTNDQRILDLPHKDLRRARAAAINIIPTTTGAATTVEKCLPELSGKLDGVAIRVPTATVSIVDFTAKVSKKTNREELNYYLKKESGKEEFKGIFGVEDALLVSSDYKGNSYSSIVDSHLTMADGDLVKVFSWYDNEYGYASRLADFAKFIGERI